MRSDTWEFMHSCCAAKRGGVLVARSPAQAQHPQVATYHMYEGPQGDSEIGRQVSTQFENLEIDVPGFDCMLLLLYLLLVRSLSLTQLVLAQVSLCLTNSE